MFYPFPVSEKSAPAETKPAVRADVLALFLLIRNTRKLMTYTVLFAAFFIIVGGFIDILSTLPKFVNDSLLGLGFTDIGLFLAGIFIGVGIINDYAKKLYSLNRPIYGAKTAEALEKLMAPITPPTAIDAPTTA